MQEFKMTESQYNTIIEKINIARTTPLIMLQCGMPESPQEAANRAWADLGKELGFDSSTVKPGRDKFTFIAEPINEARSA